MIISSLTKMKKIICLVLFCLFVSSEAYCFNIRTDTRSVKLEIVPQETYRGVIRVENPSEEEINVKAYLEDFVYTAPFDGAKNFFPPATTKHSSASWVTFSPQEFKLGPFGKSNVNYVINVPSGISGGYYTVLFFETAMGSIPDPEKEGANILVKGRLGSLFQLETKDSVRTAEIKDITAISKNIHANISNIGNTNLVCKGNFYVMDSSGNVYDRGKLKDIYLSPEDSAAFTMSLGADIPSGNYIEVLSFDLEKGDVLVREIDFSYDAVRGEIKILQVRQ